MAVATLWPAGFGARLARRRSCSSASASSFRSSAIAIQIGASLRIPVVGALLAVGGRVRSMGGQSRGRPARVRPRRRPARPIGLTLKQAYGQWKAAQRRSARTARGRWFWSPCRAARRGPAIGPRSRFDTCGKRPRPRGVELDPHMFAISSVSGGSVGAVGYAAMLKAAPGRRHDFKLTACALRRRERARRRADRHAVS